MKLVIAGSRTVSPTPFDITRALAEWLDIKPEHVTEVISGTAPGGDRAGEAWAAHYNIPIRRMPANWDEFGKIAGKMRNGEMSFVADAALVLWDGISNGSADMVARMVARGKRVAVELCEPVKKPSATGMLL